MTTRERLQRLAAPTSRTRPGRRFASVADGPACPAEPKHGATFVLPSRSTYCAHSDHSSRGTQSVWPAEPPEAIGRVTKGAEA